MDRSFRYRGRMPAAPDPAAPLTLRPRSAEVITIVVAVAAALLALDAVLRAGLTGALLLPGLAFFALRRPGAGLVCLALQGSLVGWLPAAVWAARATRAFQAGHGRQRALAARLRPG